MYAVNKLVNDAYMGVNMTGVGETTEGSLAEIGCNELNRLIADLNQQGFISMAQKWVDVPQCHEIRFKQLNVGETASPNVVDMAPPEKVEAVSRKIGESYIPMGSLDAVQMSIKNRHTIATSWNYYREYEENGGDLREVGVVRLDGNAPEGVRVFYNSVLPTYSLDGKVYLSDIYNNLLLSGLEYYLCIFHELSEVKKADKYAQFTAAQKLIKRNNITQRMLQTAPVAGGYNDAYYNGRAGAGW